MVSERAGDGDDVGSGSDLCLNAPSEDVYRPLFFQT